MSEIMIGVIGGTGLGEAFSVQTQGRQRMVQTPFGSPSGPIIMSEWSGIPIALLARHGDGHMLSPSAVPYRANIYALKSLGVTHIIASGAVGSLQDRIQPKHLVVPDQVIDKTFRRESSFFSDHLAVHVELSSPFCPHLRKLLLDSADEVDTTVHDGGTYVCMEGPQFSTQAESRMHRAWGGDLIGMTCMPEAKLARESQICYALLALPSDYDCWREHDSSLSKQELLNEIISNLQQVSEHGIKLIQTAISRAGKLADIECPDHKALELAIWSDKKRIPKEVRSQLDLLLGEYLS
ncbi:MAG: S-methyl-5'-thioadenosine phosphorylase [Actinobacteria bacterium]|nr:S-methyl-5'-thioadenosine phosphorylase [Actinomycetota bacterium]